MLFGLDQAQVIQACDVLGCLGRDMLHHAVIGKTVIGKILINTAHQACSTSGIFHLPACNVSGAKVHLRYA